MNFPLSTSEKAQSATGLVVSLQENFVKILSSVSKGEEFEQVQWLRDEGRHGGGVRFVAPSNGFFDRASVNVSHVHYDDVPEKKLASASALSAIVHPAHPYLPSIHIHFSWTEMRDGTGYWRMMADLNPSIPNEQSAILFDENLKAHSGQYFEEGKEQGDTYFYIPSLNAHRGISHFYLEGFDTGNFKKDGEMAENLAINVMKTYEEILRATLRTKTDYSDADKQSQIDYHTLYLYQVLTLDKGTTAGLLVHSQNDLGVLGSLPSTINCDLLKDWIEKTPAPLNDLVAKLYEVFNSKGNVEVGDNEKLGFAKVIRDFYVIHSDLLKFQN
ncbi:MAG: coproporphyrinogen III oxidase [Arenicella sp.]|jgi:coproporphyrinogen III oxidase